MADNSLDYNLSVLIAVAIGAEPQRCWRNAVLTILTFPTLFTSGAYVEGWIVVPHTDRIEMVEHGWSVSPGIGIVDPTIVLIEIQDQPISYFPGFEIPGSDVSQAIAGKTVPLVCTTCYGSDGMKHQGYKQSYEQAWQQAVDQAQARGLPQSTIIISRRTMKRGLTRLMEL